LKREKVFDNIFFHNLPLLYLLPINNYTQKQQKNPPKRAFAIYVLIWLISSNPEIRHLPLYLFPNLGHPKALERELEALVPVLAPARELVVLVLVPAQEPGFPPASLRHSFFSNNLRLYP
jgi:hypothetical protein